MKTDLAQSFQRLEYLPPVYTFDRVELDIALDPARTIIKSRIEVLPGKSFKPGLPLVLVGHELEFVSLRINGVPHRQFEKLSPFKLYQMQAKRNSLSKSFAYVSLRKILP